MGWTEASIRSRLRAAQAIERALLASSRTFAEERLRLLDLITAVDRGTITAQEAEVRFDEIADRYCESV